MDLDDQLAALAAGELDDDTARALRARVASDPALAQRLACLEQLERLLRSWDPPAMSREAASRLDARIDAALAELDDAPLAAQGTSTSPSLAPLAAADSSDRAAPAATGGAAADDDTVVDLTAARERRGLPAWASGLAIAAALAAVVGTGIVFGGLPGGADLDILADSADEATDDSAADSAAGSAELPEEESADQDQTESQTAAITRDGEDGATGTYSVEGSNGGSSPQRLRDVEIAPGELLQLADAGAEADQDDASGDQPAADNGEASDDGAANCIEEALRRDTDQDGDPQLQLLADGTYDGRDAVFVVLRIATATGDRIRVLAYDPGDCSLLETAETTR